MLRLTLATVLLLAPAFASASGTCPPAGESSLVAIGGVAYVSMSGHVYQETNHVAGLQTSPGACSDDNGRDHVWASDTFVL